MPHDPTERQPPTGTVERTRRIRIAFRPRTAKRAAAGSSAGSGGAVKLRLPKKLVPKLDLDTLDIRCPADANLCTKLVGLLMRHGWGLVFGKSAPRITLLDLEHIEPGCAAPK